MNAFKDNITDPEFWLRLLYTLLFAVAWQVVELLLGVILVVQILFRLFTGKPQADLAGLGNSLSQYAWQMGRYVTGASDLKPWPFIEWPAADAEWQPRPAEGPVVVDPAVSPAMEPVAPTAPVAPEPAAAPVAPVVAAEPGAAPAQSPATGPVDALEIEPVQPEPPTLQTLADDVNDVPGTPDDGPRS